MKAQKIQHNFLPHTKFLIHNRILTKFPLKDYIKKEERKKYKNRKKAP